VPPAEGLKRSALNINQITFEHRIAEFSLAVAFVGGLAVSANAQLMTHKDRTPIQSAIPLYPGCSSK
jgi:hypothetical protein